MKRVILLGIAIFFLTLASADEATPLLKPFGIHAPALTEISKERLYDIPVKIELGFVIVEIMLNNQGPFRFILDTGSDTSILSLELVKKLNLKPNKTKKSVFHTQHKQIEIETFMLNIEELKMGDIQFKNAPFIASNAASDDFQLLKNLEIEGVIGENMFYDLIMILDLPQKKISIQHPDSMSYEGKKSIPIGHDNYLPIIKANVIKDATSTPYLFLIDTGYTGFVKMPECYTNGETPVINSVRTLDAFNLAENGFLAELDGTLEIGTIQIERPIVKYEMGACVKLPPWGLIGTQFLLYHKVGIDQRHRYIFFNP